MEDLKNLKDEIKILQSSYNNVESTEKSIDNGIQNIKVVIDSLEYFNRNIEMTNNILQRRFLIQSLVQRIIWNGDTYDAKIELIGIGDINEELKKK